MKGSRTPIEVKTKAIEGIINGELGSKIADNLGIHESTVSRIKDKDLTEYLSKNPDKARIYENNKLGLEVKDIENLSIDEEILSEYLLFVGGYKEAKESIECFMLQSLGKSYIKRKAINKNTRYSILERSGFKCQACGSKPSSNNDVSLEIDHIVPHSMGGLSVDNNYQVLCLKCNTSKSNKFIYNHNNNEMKEN